MSAIDQLPPLRDVIATHGLSARKSLGQNFLLDLNLTAKIARVAGDLRECDVLEIGPGPGGLTRGLLSEGARRVLAIEKDRRCIPALEEISAAYPDRLEVIEGDALEVDPLTHLTPPHSRGRKPALQRGHGTLGALVNTAPMAPLLAIAYIDVPKRGC